MGIDYELKELFESELCDDEQVEWCAKPIDKPTLSERGDKGIALMVMIGWILMTTFIMLILAKDGIGMAALVWIIFNLPCALIMAAVGLFRHEVYCMTNRRILIHNGKKVIGTYEIGLLHRVKFKASSRGVGQITFNTQHLVNTRQGKREFQTVNICSVENVEEVYEYMLKCGARAEEA